MKTNKNPLNFAVQYLTINHNYVDQRLDNLLYNFFNQNLARCMVQEIIRTGQVRVNKKRAKNNYRLKLNDMIRIPPVRLNPNNLISTNKVNNVALKQQMKLWQPILSKAILMETKDFLVINKPSGLAVHGGSKIKVGLIDLIKLLKPEEPFLELVHRLDRDTSGCIIFAKNRPYLRRLHTLLREHKITKVYTALVKGCLSEKKIIDASLKKFITSSKEHVVRIVENGSYAKTICFPIKQLLLDNQKSSWVNIKPITGKTHQIRVHLASIGLPIANDDKYGDRNYNNLVSNLGLTRMMLHARSIEFICPNSNQLMLIKAPYDYNSNNFLLKCGVFCE